MLSVITGLKSANLVAFPTVGIAANANLNPWLY